MGGYALERSLDQVSLLEIVEAIEGPLGGGAGLEVELTEGGQSALGVAMASIAANVRRDMAAIKLSQFLPPPGPCGGIAHDTGSNNIPSPSA